MNSIKGYAKYLLNNYTNNKDKIYTDLYSYKIYTDLYSYIENETIPGILLKEDSQDIKINILQSIKNDIIFSTLFDDNTIRPLSYKDWMINNRIQTIESILME